MPNAYQLMATEELDTLIAQLEGETDRIRARKLSLDMARGKPCAEQVALSKPMFDLLTSETPLVDGNAIVDNYGTPDGLPSARRLAAEILGVDADNVIVNGSSSLNLMHDLVANGFVHGIAGQKPWYQQGQVKFLCPSPGYDRHFAITQEFGFEMITVPMTPTGPDMDVVEALVKDDPGIKGIWCVPLYSNPQGICYSDETVDRLSKMQCAAPDFRIFWDNAYGVHHLYGENKLKNILASCAAAGNPERACYFFSTSKITFPGGGVAMMAVGPESRKELLKRIGVQTIGSDKLNQLRTLNFLKNPENARRHMEKIAASLRPKFETVLEILERELGGTGLAVWNKPQGGYFVAVDTIPGCAKEVVKMAAEAGVVMTGAGATFPYGKEPNDSNIRIAPSFPTVEELACAMELFCICVRMVCIKKLMQSK